MSPCVINETSPLNEVKNAENLKNGKKNALQFVIMYALIDRSQQVIKKKMRLTFNFEPKRYPENAF